MGVYGLIIGILCVWRFTHLLNAEDGPGDIIVRLRSGVRNGFWGNLMDCFYCLSLWIAIPFAILLGRRWNEQLILWPALSAGAIIIEEILRWLKPPAAQYYEENDDALLRSEASGDDGGVTESDPE